MTPREVHDAVVAHGYSRYVVRGEGGDADLAGYLHVKDVMDLDGHRFDEPVPAKRVRQLPAVPCDAELEDGLRTLRERGAHVARAVDAEGSVVGLLFLEDALEVLVGEVADATSARA